MKSTHKHPQPDALQNFLLGFKLRVCRRIQIAAVNTMEFVHSALEYMATHKSSSTFGYTVYWQHVVTASNIKAIREKIPFDPIRQVLKAGDTVWCIKRGIDGPGYVFYSARERNAFKPDGAVGLNGQCLWGNWISPYKIRLNDHSYFTVDGEYLSSPDTQAEGVGQEDFSNDILTQR